MKRKASLFSPLCTQIDELVWGRVVISHAGKTLVYGEDGNRGDVVICGTGPPTQWNWKHSATAVDTSGKRKPLIHSPGITEETISRLAAELLETCQFATKHYLIVSMGFDSQLPMVNPQQNIKSVQLEQIPTGDVLKARFNKLSADADTAVALLLHVTC